MKITQFVELIREIDVFIMLISELIFQLISLYQKIIIQNNLLYLKIKIYEDLESAIMKIKAP
jgi:hypothetical protein